MALASHSAVMWRRATCHSSCCPTKTASTKRMMAAPSGKMATTSDRRRIFAFRRSWELFDQICRQCSSGKELKAVISGAASSSMRVTSGKRSSSCVTTRLSLAWTSSCEG